MAMDSGGPVMGASIAYAERVAPSVYNLDENWPWHWLGQYSHHTRGVVLYIGVANGIDHAAVRQGSDDKET